MRKLLLGLYLGLVFTGTAFAKPQVESFLSASKIPLNKTADLKIQIEWPRSEAQYGFAVPEIPLRDMTLLRQGESQEFFKRDNEDWVRKVFTIELAPIRKGKAGIREFIIPYVDPANQQGGNLSIPAYEITVTGVPLSGGSLYLISIGITTVFFAGIGVYLFGKKKKQNVSEPESPGAVSGKKIKDLLENAQAKDRKEMLYEISMQFREFVVECYQLAAKSSDDEIIAALKAKGILSEESDRIKGIFDKIRETKFMGAAVTADDLRQLQYQILQLVDSKKIYGNS